MDEVILLDRSSSMPEQYKRENSEFASSNYGSVGDAMMLDRSSSFPDHHHHQRRGSGPSLRRRAKSPGRRLTDAYVRSSCAIDCDASPTVKRAFSVSNLLAGRAGKVKTEAVDGESVNARSDLSMSVDCTRSVSRIAYIEDNNNDGFRDDLGASFSAIPLLNYGSDDVFIQSNTAESYDSDASPVKKRFKSKGSNLSSGPSLSKKSAHNSRDQSHLMRLISALWGLLVRLFCFSLLLGCLIFLGSFCIIWMRNRCGVLQTSHFELGVLRETLSKHVVGQEIAIDQMIETLDQFHKFTEPNIMWCVGWTGGGKSKSMDILKRVLSKQANVQYFLPTLIPSDGELFDNFVNDAVTNMNPCQKDIVIVDGWDSRDDETVIRFVKAMVEKVKQLAKEDSTMNELLVVVTGVRGSTALNREYLSQRLLDKQRDDLSVGSLLDVITRTNEFDLITSLGPVAIVPFLPLETAHVTECIRNELVYVKKLIKFGQVILGNYDVLNRLDDNKIIDTVLSRLTFLPDNHPLMSSTGCKRVLSTLKLILGDVDANPGTE